MDMKIELISNKTPELEAIEPSKAERIIQAFQPSALRYADLEENYQTIIKKSKEKIDVDLSAKAKKLRIETGKIRIATNKIKDAQKEFIKMEDKAIMGVHNFIVLAVKEREQNLLAIEKHFEKLEKDRLLLLQEERVLQLSKYVEDAHHRDLVKFEEDEFEALLQTKKKQFEDKIAAEKRAEEERIKRKKEEQIYQERKEKLIDYWNYLDDQSKKINYAKLGNVEFAELLAKAKELFKKEEERRETVRKENERLKKIAKAKEAKEAMERKKRMEEERKAKEAHEAQIRKEREEKEKLKKKLEEKEEAERKAKEEAERLRQEELRKGDLEKLKDMIAEAETLIAKYQFDSEENKKKKESAAQLFKAGIKILKG